MNTYNHFGEYFSEENYPAVKVEEKQTTPETSTEEDLVEDNRKKVDQVL